MKNLAGNKDCDEYIREELTRARVPAVDVERTNSEVPYTVVGRLGKMFKFTRNWYYWVVKGPVPLEVAKKLYADPVGKKDVRAGGDCTCPDPDGSYVVNHFDIDGLQLCNDPDGSQEKEYRKFVEKGILDQAGLDRLHFVKDAAAVAVTSFVDTYHIDSEVGLRLFVDTIRDLPDAQE